MYEQQDRSNSVSAKEERKKFKREKKFKGRLSNLINQKPIKLKVSR
jgi:hypothetical protein